MITSWIMKPSNPDKDFYKLLSFGVDWMKNMPARGILRLVNFQKSSPLKQQCYML
jgi:hypothetical protein